MAAFERIISGVNGMDEALDSIRLGDNVVLQVTELSEYMFFARAFAAQAIRDKRNLIYIRFAQHEPVLEPQEGVKIFEFDPDQGFESFTVAIRERITEEGFDAFYVFDSLSELQSVWYTDLMMGNFFRVTCPYLFILDTVAFFPILRGRHSHDAVARIRETTQLFLDVYSDRNGDDMYLHPLKVWNRYSESMFLPHLWKKETGTMQLVKDGVGMSRYYRVREDTEIPSVDLQTDSYDRFFTLAKLQYAAGTFTKETEQLIVESTMTKDKKMQKLIRQYFRPSDYFNLRDRMIGSGAIGGKACGMLLARRIIERELPQYRHLYEPHDSYYIGSDVFYTYIVANDCWVERIKQRTEEGYFTAADTLKECFLNGTFPPNIREQFRSTLEYFGQNPIIVRSSSFLEDGFGNAFAGKYESYFCSNRGTPEERLEEFEQAVRMVYASTMDISALEYRRQRGLEKKDEQMAVLVQRVSGSYYGDIYMPAAAGVGYSYSTYKWMEDINPNAGMLRLVVGLGTKAVDRTKQDYPRLVNLDRPTVTVAKNVAEKHRFSQHYLDVLDLSGNGLTEKSLNEILPLMPKWMKTMLLEHDTDAEQRLFDMGRPRNVWFVSCQKLLQNKEFTSLMKDVLQTLQRVYGNPVDIEYTINISETGEFVVNLLQCRPLYVGKDGGRVDMPDLSEEDCFFDIKDASMGQSSIRDLSVVVQVDPKLYYEYPYAKKHDVATAIGEINRYCRELGMDKKTMLTVPGRIGTSSPELGVPVAFADISGFCSICEVSDSRAGYMPELSFGSHMFQDLVEAEIFYGAIYEDKKTRHFNRDYFEGCADLFDEACPKRPELKYMIRVWDLREREIKLWIDSADNHAICGDAVAIVE
ncbi:MAG: PEP/pyruvate-binding domain-containing protein [Clostridiales bacterium]|nr:PEP/pyruvate-binding domain-containing protein [Clostridiales bacterium]